MIIDANIAQNMTPAVFFTRHIHQHAVQYFPDLKVQEVNVRLVHAQQYRHSQFYRFEVRGKWRREILSRVSENTSIAFSF